MKIKRFNPVRSEVYMKITKFNQDDFLRAVDKCAGNVFLVSPYGDRYNLKSQLNGYLALSALLGDHGDELELFCDVKSDEQFLFGFFNEHPESLNMNFN